MVKLKTSAEIETMAEGGKRLRAAFAALKPFIKAGATTLEIDQKAEELIRAQGGESSFKRVPGYKWTICCPINEQVVHTPPSTRVLKNGDVLTVDIGMYYKGFHTDFADTWVVGGKTDKETEKFLSIGRLAFEKALKVVGNNRYVGEISRVIQQEVEGSGLFVMRDLTGHGVGRDLHEDPSVPGILEGKIEKTYKMRPGLVIAVEVIYSKGTREIAYEKDDSWSITTKDGSLSGCFEHTIAIGETNAFILT